MDKNGVYQMTWVFNDGAQYIGTALLNGQQLSAVFNDLDLTHKNHIGLQTYTIGQGALEGAWVLLNRNLTAKEKLTKQ